MHYIDPTHCCTSAWVNKKWSNRAMALWFFTSPISHNQHRKGFTRWSCCSCVSWKQPAESNAELPLPIDGNVLPSSDDENDRDSSSMDRYYIDGDTETIKTLISFDAVQFNETWKTFRCLWKPCRRWTVSKNPNFNRRSFPLDSLNERTGRNILNLHEYLV